MQATSIAAKKSFDKSGEKIEHHRKIIAALQFIGKGTFSQISNVSGLAYHQVGRRVHELVCKGLVCDTGELGRSPSGRAAIVWGLVK